MRGEALWQNQKFITPNKKRSKTFTDFLKKRDDKLQRKEDKKKLLLEGKDKDADLDDAAFE